MRTLLSMTLLLVATAGPASAQVRAPVLEAGTPVSSPLMEWSSGAGTIYFQAGGCRFAALDYPIPSSGAERPLTRLLEGLDADYDYANQPD